MSLSTMVRVHTFESFYNVSAHVAMLHDAPNTHKRYHTIQAPAAREFRYNVRKAPCISLLLPSINCFLVYRTQSPAEILQFLSVTCPVPTMTFQPTQCTRCDVDGMARHSSETGDFETVTVAVDAWA